MRTSPRTARQKFSRTLLRLSLFVNPGTMVFAGLCAGPIALVLIMVFIIAPRIL